jgi:hypothetical protein
MDQQQVIVRRSVRYDVSMRASVAISGEHSGLTRFSAASGAREGWIDLDVIDFSASGMGMISQVFIPRKTMLTVRIYGHGPNAPVILTVPVRVQRVCMTDRRPAYLLGTSVENPPPKSVEEIQKLIALLEGDPVPPSAAPAQA